MKKTIVATILLSSMASNALSCCCEAIIQEKTTSLDSHLESKNKANVEALDKLLTKIGTLNKDVLEDRSSSLNDTDSINSLAKVNITNAKNLYHAISLVQGVQYYQMKKDEFHKDELIAAISNQIDVNNIASRTMMHAVQNNIYNINRATESVKEEDVKQFLNIDK